MVNLPPAIVKFYGPQYCAGVNKFARINTVANNKDQVGILHFRAKGLKLDKATTYAQLSIKEYGTKDFAPILQAVNGNKPPRRGAHLYVPQKADIDKAINTKAAATEGKATAELCEAQRQRGLAAHSVRHAKTPQEKAQARRQDKATYWRLMDIIR